MSNFDDFMNKFKVKYARVVPGKNYETINHGSTITASYYLDREEVVEMELPLRGFEELVRMDTEYTRIWQDERDEVWLRKTYPALKDAYDKYQMLLALYK
jgi:hypothetical protein